MLDWFGGLQGIKIQLAAKCLQMSCKPTAKFATHLRATPPSLTVVFASRLRCDILRAYEKVLRVPTGSLTDSPPSRASGDRLMSPTSAGGAGVADPVVVACPAFLAGMADSYGPLLLQEDLRQWLTDFDSWQDSLRRHPGLSATPMPCSTIWHRS